MKNIGTTEAQALLRNIAEHADEYAGIPMPMDGENLIIHPRYRFASILNKKLETEDVEVINSWVSKRLRKRVVIYKGGWGVMEVEEIGNEIDRILRTFGLNGVWSLDAEAKAIRKLCELIPHHQFRGYMLTGTFIESSKRSGVTYIFRRLRPTIAISSQNGYVKFLAALCMHPIGYYDESFAGSMVPTDEVIAHLVMMRGDEHAFWKYSNQHQTL